ncbi:DUF2924 domain-containing protein [Tsuneonella sp. SYSU-LHT278]|uniref:DUF2924 domain-containing protein n=1 Tax=Tsuneonella sediminis TaxID=3416089 RepID=UPI003F7977F5
MSRDVAQAVVEIGTMDLEQLRTEWRRRYGAPPRLRSVSIMRQLVAWRVQVEAFGGLDTDTRKALARTGAAAPEGQHLGVGARLTRKWKGRTVEVVVEERGFRFEDRLFPSLSAAATAIAGSKWNGPRFFGLRDAS